MSNNSKPTNPLFIFFLIAAILWTQKCLYFFGIINLFINMFCLCKNINYIRIQIGIQIIRSKVNHRAYTVELLNIYMKWGKSLCYQV